MHLFIFSLLLCFLSPTFASSPVIDYSTTTFVRSYPPGFFTSGTVGVGQKFWKERRAPFLYGFIRPSFTIQTSAVVNTGQVELDLFPISFWGIYTGTDRTNRNFDIKTFDCSVVLCQGDLRRDYVGSKMALQYQKAFVLFDYRLIKLTNESDKKPFAEERSTLVAAPGKDYLQKYELLAGVNLTPLWALGILSLKHDMRIYSNDTHMKMIFVKRNLLKGNLIIAAGSFEDRFNKDIFSIVMGLQWWGEKGLMLY